MLESIYIFAVLLQVTNAVALFVIMRSGILDSSYLQIRAKEEAVWSHLAIV